MKNRTLLIYLNFLGILFIVLFTTCTDKEDLPIIDITDQVDFLNHPFYDCFSPVGEAYRREIIFTDNAAYQAFGTYAIAMYGKYQPSCKSAALPLFDFNKYSILGNYTVLKGAYTKFKYKITDNPNNRTITYSIKIEYLNNSTGVGLPYYMNWAVIPKLKLYYNVIFEVEQIGVDEFTSPE